MRLKEACERTNLPKRTIHYYIKEELISPKTDPANGYFDFSEEDCQRLRLIVKFRDAGLSIAVIRSILSNPNTANYYLKVYLHDLYREYHTIKEKIIQLNQIVSSLPFHPDNQTLSEAFLASDFPSRMDKTEKVYDHTMVNFFIWSNFIPSETFTEYQEFLWQKINDLTKNNPPKDYLTLSQFLFSLSQEEVDLLYLQNSKQYEIVSNCKREDFEVLAKKLQKDLLHFLKDEHLIRKWKQSYECYFHPSTSIASSEIGDLFAKLSPFFDLFRKNINEINTMIYNWLNSKEGRPVRDLIYKKLGSDVDIDHFNHGQLTAMAIIK